jgi:starch-binding outer membrane protein, SusD/RagB family
MKTINKISGLLILPLLLVCCRKQVDLSPTDLILQENVFRTVGDLERGVNGVYGTIQERRVIYVSALMSDEVRQGTGSEYRGVGANLFRWEFTSDAQDFRDAEAGGVWTNMYQVVDRANRILAVIDQVGTTTDAETNQKERIRGELLALRAFAHFELMRVYATSYDPAGLGVPYLSSYASDPANFRPSRDQQSVVYNGIKADLARARTLIPATFTDISRITRNAVIALQARVSLYTRDWASAVTSATEVINAQPLTPRSTYPALWTTRNLASNQNTEVIWKLNISASNLSNAVGSLFQDIGGALQFGPSQKLLNSYDQVNDIRFPTFFRTTPRNLVSKYGSTPNTGENFMYDIKVLRTSEMYLIRAEANAELNNLLAANTDLATLRAARIANYVHVPIATQPGLINEVMLERFRELCFEGHRYYDLKRRNLPIERLPEDVQNNATYQRLEPTNFRYILPIPQQELFANPNIQQNPGYQ